MARKKHEVTCNYHYHYMMPAPMAPMGVMGEMAYDPAMMEMYDSMHSMPGMHYPGCPMHDHMGGSHLDGNPDGVAAGAFAGGPFFSPFFFPFIFRRRFFRFSLFSFSPFLGN